MPDLPHLSILSLTRYKQLVEGLETFKGHDDDKRRKKKRKDLLLLPVYEEKEFTPRDFDRYFATRACWGALALRKAVHWLRKLTRHYFIARLGHGRGSQGVEGAWLPEPRRTPSAR